MCTKHNDRVEPIHSAAAMASLSYRNACPNFHCKVIISLSMHTAIPLSTSPKVPIPAMVC
ncbi:hypothetical protein CY34DRAFT_803940 [Suillus luteus UH-Slu-Lm8-n1]|uniref:Uncharacterized protein n=1 Tax=Suillus luteus UH-Slu-Lm8-n1 TaxID=930992 RepID=A0A0D0AZU7_9AGAM|nr:hypothetical protein CY34DRAFT_803940 [Suillus luteus UH-Slu-Lm8-n1]